MKDLSDNEVLLAKNMIKHIHEKSSFDLEIKRNLSVLFMITPVNSKGKMLFDYNFIFNLKDKKLDGLLCSKLRGIAKRLGVNNEIIKASLPYEVSWHNKWSDENMKKFLEKNDFQYLYNAGKYKGKAELNFMFNKDNIMKLIYNIFELNNSNK